MHPAAEQLPLVETVYPAPEPSDAFRRLAHLPFVLFFDSAALHPERGRYSYLAALPFEVILGSGSELRVARRPPVEPAREATQEMQTVADLRGDPFALVAERLRAWPALEQEGLPPFQGGAAGLFGYGLGRAIEKLPAPRFDEFQVPDLALGLYDWVIAFDHRRGDCHLIAHGFPGMSPAERREQAGRRIRQLRGLLGSSPREFPPRPREPAPLDRGDLAPQWPVPGAPGLLSNFARDDYTAAVARVVDYIHAGDIFQANLSQRFLHPGRLPPAEFYVRLRAANPAAFAAYFDLGDFVVASSSPEQFLALSGRRVTTRPIKGTRPRGCTPEEDGCRQQELLGSEKDRAENLMIVDLLRNDLSRVCAPHTVKVPHLFELERHPTVHHLVSEVRGELRDGRGALDLLRAAFPGGSITGAPKVRAMEIIAELEPTARGPYCGSLAWIAFHGGMGSSILIRTVTIGRGWLQLPAGGGIVADSRPGAEYQETLDKAAGMVRALG